MENTRQIEPRPRPPETDQGMTEPGDHLQEASLDSQRIAAEAERNLAAAEDAIARVLSGDSLAFLQSFVQESGE